MCQADSVLVAILNRHQDLDIALEQHWYRIPVASQQRSLKRRWPPSWLAFYQTKTFGQDAYSVRYFAKVLEIRQKQRWELFADESQDEHGGTLYHQLILEPLQRLAQPIVSRRWRRIVFIQTTWQKFTGAAEINDLSDESPLEDRLWAEFKRLRIAAERQEWVQVDQRNYFLDFAIYCALGKLDVETDGDRWHANPKRAARDNLRDNDLERSGWQQLRFTTRQIQQEMAEYCIPTVTATINRLGGLDEGEDLPSRRVDPDLPDGTYQLGLFG